MNDPIIIAEPSDLRERSEVPALTDLNSKQEIIDHLFYIHHGAHEFTVANQVVHAHDTKATKEQMLAHHKQLHSVLDAPDRFESEGDICRTTVSDKGYTQWHRAPTPQFEHIHILDSETADRVEAAKSNKPIGDKPLNPRELKILQELVDNDFSSLKSQMRAFAADNLAATKAEINAEWDAKVRAADKLVGRAAAVKARHKLAMEDLRDKQRREWDAIVAEAKERGYDLQAKERQVLNPEGGSMPQTYYEAEAFGRKEALDAAEKENKLSIDRALMTLERQRLDAQRQVLVSGVSKEAAGILDTIPSAQTMMVEAGLTEQPKAIG